MAVARTVYLTASSLDGFIADEQGSLEWLTSRPRSRVKSDRFAAFYASIGAIVMGSTTFEWTLSTQGLDEPGRWRDEWQGRSAWIFSTRELTLPDDSDIRIVSGDVCSHHDGIVGSAGGKDVWVVGGGGLAAQFADAGLLDGVRVGVVPVTLGSGAALLPRRLTDRLRLTGVSSDGDSAFLDYELLPTGLST